MAFLHSRGPVLPRTEDLTGRPAWATALVLARISAGLTQQEVADRLRLTKSYISRAEGGRIAVGPAQLARIHAAIDREDGVR